MTVHTPYTASASTFPCELYTYHRPRPARTQGHHRYPEYLQKRLWGRTLDDELLYVCGTCHDNIHEVLAWLLGEARKPNPMPGHKAIQEARRTFAWYCDNIP